MMVPVGRLVLLRSVPKAELVTAMAYLTIPAMIGPVLGPPVGGAIVTYASWRWIFFLHVPIGLLGIVLVSVFVENFREAETPRLDIAGFVLSGTALAGLMLGFETVGRDGVPLPAALALLAVGGIAVAGYLHHAARHPHPILDLLLLRVPTFAIAVAGGFLFRLGIGALPFLLPLMLQIGYGLTPFQSGTITFVSAVGAIVLKFVAPPLLRRFGFRRVLIANSFIAAFFVAVPAAFSINTSMHLITGLLFIGGFFRSLQFTSANALSFADVPLARMSRATSLTSVFQQLSLSLGISVGAISLQLTMTAHGGALSLADFHPAFLVVGLISMCSVIAFIRMPHDAGEEMSGRRTVTKELAPDPVTAMRERG
jgi:MFS family permease